MKSIYLRVIDRVSLLVTAILVIALVTVAFLVLDALKLPNPLMRYALDFLISGIAAFLGFQINRRLERLFK